MLVTSAGQPKLARTCKVLRFLVLHKNSCYVVATKTSLLEKHLNKLAPPHDHERSLTNNSITIIYLRDLASVKCCSNCIDEHELVDFLLGRLADRFDVGIVVDSHACYYYGADSSPCKRFGGYSSCTGGLAVAFSKLVSVFC